ncbi:CENP-B homolog protein 2-like [Apium graveolens]|uniref:CENP-B homolog protein 2-like n=1 Tax=Apium graveolens TaxID=4045 RepID=UPI003D7AF7E2
MASHLKGVTKSTMTDEARKALCEYKRENSSCTQKDLQLWLENKFHLKVSQGTISNTLKRSADYLAANYLEKRKDIKRHKPAKYPDMEKVLYEWFLQYQDRVNMTEELILEKAKETMKILYPQQDQEHTFSQGWLDKFKLRHGIKSFRRFGESGSVDVQDMEKKLESIREKINQFPMKDVFNMDETGLFYRLQADHSLATKQLEGRKQDKERLTVVICYNEDGSEKIPLWIIGKYAKPRCFKNVNMGSLNCHYRANKRAWMTSVLFDEYIRWFDSQMQGRRILFVVDNCPAHPKNIEGLQNVELYFLPPNMTSKIQPCDAGIIRAFKMHYRRRFYRGLLEGYELGQSNPGKINVLDAINYVVATWTTNVKQESIANELEVMIKDLGYRNKMDVNNFLDYPGENESCSEVQSIEKIANTILENSVEDDLEDDTTPLEPVTRKEALKASKMLNNFLMQHESTTPELLDAIRKIRDELHVDLNYMKKQTTIESYFIKM